MEQFRGKKVLIVGMSRTGFALLNFFNRMDCQIRVNDIKPIFDLNKTVKKLKKISPRPEMTFGENREEDFLNADVIVYSSSLDPELPQLKMAIEAGKQVYSEFALASLLCNRPIIAVCGSWGRTTVAHMIGFILKLEGKNVFVGGTSETPFIEYAMLPNQDEIDYVVVEVSAIQMRRLENFSPSLVVFTNINENYPRPYFSSFEDYLGVKLRIVKKLTKDNFLVCNFDTLSGQNLFANAKCSVCWYSRKSFVKMGVINEVQGTHFYERRIHSNINYHSNFKVTNMRIVGMENRENLLAAITACKALNISDKSIQRGIERFPGIPHRLEFLLEKNGVRFYNDSKCEDMDTLVKSISSFKTPLILIMGGKENDEEMDFGAYRDEIVSCVRVLVLVGESKEKLNRAFGLYAQTYLVGSFEESVLVAYQKSRTGDTILLSPGNPSSDFFRDYEERGNYFKKLVYQF